MSILRSGEIFSFNDLIMDLLLRNEAVECNSSTNTFLYLNCFAIEFIAFSVNNDGHAFAVGNITAVGTITAASYIGDGSQLTGIVAANVANATTANTADFATVAGLANSIAANTVDSSKIVNNSITAADIVANGITTSELAPGAVRNINIFNGAVTNAKITGPIDASKISGNLTNVNISKLVAPDGSPNPALQVDNSGRIGIGTGVVSPHSTVHIRNLSSTITAQHTDEALW
jgi:hypothetical protein